MSTDRYFWINPYMTLSVSVTSVLKTIAINGGNSGMEMPVF